MSQRVTHLQNGVAVVSDAMPSSASISIGVYVGAGARSETVQEHGMAHLLEHMAFKGTTRRSAHAIADEIEAVGGDINAGTSMEQTAYYARVLKEDMGLAVDILADILTNSTFEASELQREQAVIVQEIGAARDAPDDLVFELLQEAAFPDQPIGRSILGTPDTVCGFTRTDVQSFLDTHYRGERLVVAAAGAVEHDAFVAQVQQHFSGLQQPAAPSSPPCAFVGGVRRLERDLEQVNVALGWGGVRSRDPRIYAAQVFANLLGGGMSSRLFQEIREKRGLCYTISSFHWAYEDTGLFGIHAACAPHETQDLIALIQAELQRAALDVSQNELDKAKAQLRAGLLMSLESSGARLERLARSMLMHQRLRSVDEMVQQIEQVDLTRVRDFVAHLLATPTPALSLVGAVGALSV